MEAAALGRHPWSRTVTPNRGKVFAAFAEVEAASGVGFFFAPPNAPCSGAPARKPTDSCASTSGGTDSDEEAAAVYDAINMRPRKRLGFRTSYEAHYSEPLQLL